MFLYECCFVKSELLNGLFFFQASPQQEEGENLVNKAKEAPTVAPFVDSSLDAG